MNITEDELRARLQIWRAVGIGPATLNRLLNHFGSAVAALDGSDAELAKAGLKPDTLQNLRSVPIEATLADLEWLHRAQHRHILVPEDPRYPKLLRDLKAAPPILFVAGQPELLNEPQLAMVGSRTPTTYGKENAQAFAQYLAKHGITVTSGLALGIDAVSHQGALEAGGTTIAVIATGLDIIYPAKNRSLAERIVEHGAIVSEFPIGVKPQAQNFPRRNRIISGLSLGSLVVEAALQSGSLVTAQHALEQGREVFAIPGSIHSPLAHGCHRLIRQGAKLVETAADILEELTPQLHAYLGSTAMPTALALSTTQASKPIKPTKPLSFLKSLTTQENTEERSEAKLDPEEQQILATIGLEPIPIDQIVLQTGLTPDVVSSMLLMLELQGYIAACGGGRYQRL
ncbi:DNA protecting protein DprA [Thiothrix eikelboomii]|uniref:DNA protecting protein DprA n=1 Tax=Thiothrix eikelboomii TaxID=92487 RepID=A0A1T4VTS5_9GAMM|nr:DNA-processing protein DprA [Thiothrix eikelboomii]SKA68363.1 DNA protecting protein DprA [Thiothrix eikelboomii]